MLFIKASQAMNIVTKEGKRAEIVLANLQHSLLGSYSKVQNIRQMATRSVEDMRKAQRADGPATILGIGTATPSNYILQADYPDYYFRITRSEHMTKLKQKFKRICKSSTIKKRHFYLNEAILKENPNLCAYMAPSLDTRREMIAKAVPRLGKEAAVKAIQDWGLTHIVFCTIAGMELPGFDYQLINQLGLDPSVKRVMLYQHGCFGGGTVLRIAKDLAENNKGARVLVVCSEITVSIFRGPSHTHMDSLVVQSLFGDGAAAVIVGSDPETSIERPLFELVSAAETILPSSPDHEGCSFAGGVGEDGLTVDLPRNVPLSISNNIEKCLEEAFTPLGIKDWNSIFWIAHPGGPAILDHIDSKLGLKEERLRATRKVLREYGNIISSTVLFILDEMRKKSIEEGKVTTGEGLQWGVLFGFGPGLTVETLVLHSLPI
ncbi:hypothetical protein Tsubulata_025039 [Turnera subulata]|uniref:Chalcone synthase n=1 Tax=Turnera subulata TaxID=218843 RepID=A0A9Q0J8N7_9ROSI|nr:hypothetical protein Tsubulata_025039 [Turnera subulata]